jgi:8-oxo-dGTP pyrophosphatase MutT (NUDIX family)
MGVGEAQFWIGVHGVIIREGGRVLVLRRARAMVYRPSHWDLPGGHLAADEEIQDCLRREIAEETGLEVKIGALLGFNKASHGPYVQIFFACRTSEAIDEIKLRPDEHDAAQWLTIAQMRQLPTLIPYLAAILNRGMLDRI